MKAERIESILLTLTPKEAKVLAAYISAERWPSDEEAQGPLNDIWVALDEAAAT